MKGPDFLPHCAIFSLASLFNRENWADIIILKAQTATLHQWVDVMKNMDTDAFHVLLETFPCKSIMCEAEVFRCGASCFGMPNATCRTCHMPFKKRSVSGSSHV